MPKSLYSITIIETLLLNGIAELLFIDRFANLLLERGIKKGDKVAILLMNCLEWLPIYFGILKTGAIAEIMPRPNSMLATRLAFSSKTDQVISRR